MPCIPKRVEGSPTVADFGSSGVPPRTFFIGSSSKTAVQHKNRSRFILNPAKFTTSSSRHPPWISMLEPSLSKADFHSLTRGLTLV